MTTAPHDATRIPTSPFGPRLMSFVGVLTGYYHLSRRKAASLLSDMMGVKLSLGAVSTVEKRVSDAVAKPVQEALFGTELIAPEALQRMSDDMRRRRAAPVPAAQAAI